MQPESIVKKENKTFKVIDVKSNQEIDDAFVLMPEKDSAARVALAAYGEATNKPKIARWIRGWLQDIHRKRMERKERLTNEDHNRD
ncbi:MAG: hypothetical protein WC549_07540 [Actinomycetota bacterium]